jgi:hypothetical protein
MKAFGFKKLMCLAGDIEHEVRAHSGGKEQALTGKNLPARQEFSAN